MGIFDKLKRKSSSLTIEKIIATDYSQKYFDECKYIWKNYVPKSGQADNLQGELLREIEEITLIMSYIKECGMYAQKFNSGIIPENEVDIDKIAYTDNNLYDIICDKIGQLQKEHNFPIPYVQNDTIKR